MTEGRFYITTPIYYVNDEPHIDIDAEGGVIRIAGPNASALFVNVRLDR